MLVAVFLFLFSGGVLPAVASAGDGSTTTPSAAPTAVSVDSGAPESKDEKAWWEEAESFLKSFLTIAGLVIGTFLVVAGLLAIAWITKGRRRASLMIEPLADGGVDPKVGAVMAGLIQKRLAELSEERGRQSPGPYRLDLFIHPDLALLGRSESLQTALAGLADSSQFKIVVALISLIDQKVGDHLVAKGELAPPGRDGYGVVLSLQSEKNGIESNGSLWDGTVASTSAVNGNTAARPYYELADRSAAWIQYEAARALDKTEVSLMTDSARSFSLVSAASVRMRAGDPDGAAELYVSALTIDEENVAALINLSALLAGHYKLYEPAVKLLGQARVALWNRYKAAEKRAAEKRKGA
jgi:hypothetical protein